MLNSICGIIIGQKYTILQKDKEKATILYEDIFCKKKKLTGRKALLKDKFSHLKKVKFLLFKESYLCRRK
jgi:hypothetical protein